MQKIYSKVSPDEQLLHIVVRKSDFKEGRQDIIDPDNWLQMSLLQMDKYKSFRPHRHLWNERIENYIAQESWIVISGSVKAVLYDIDDSILEEIVLKEGDFSITLEAAHNYFILEENTKVIEVKTGKYLGQSFDKTFID